MHTSVGSSKHLSLSLPNKLICGLTFYTKNYCNLKTKPVPPRYNKPIPVPRVTFHQPPPPLSLSLPNRNISLAVQEEMRDRMERFVLLPFTVGCVSEASVAVGVQQPRRSKSDTNTNSSAIRNKEEEEEEEEEESLSDESMKSSYRFLAIPKPNISTGFHRLFKSFKSFSQLFVYKEEMEMDMEIGLPTDVKHVTHIGWDGSATTNPMKGWDNLIAPEFLSLPSVSLNQFELSMPAQAADAPHDQLVNGSS